ncbi:hypothetical protein Tco_1283522 [Tanacetum coccineum]
MGWVVISNAVMESVTPSPAAENIILRNVGVGERYFRESNFDRLLIPFFLSSSLLPWLIAAMLLGAIGFPAFLVLASSEEWTEIDRLWASEGLGMCPVEVWFLLLGVGGIIEISLVLVVSEQDELPSSIELDFQARLDGGQIVKVTKLTTGRLVDGSSCDGINMVIKNLDLEPKVYAMDIVAEFCGPSRWKELSKESGSKILLCGDGSCWKALKLIASLITKEKLK